MQDTATKTPFRHPFQVFDWMTESWDIALMIADIDAGKLVPKKSTLDREFIEGYARQAMALRRDRPIDQQGMSLFVAVDAQRAVELPAEALAEPVILLEVRAKRGILVLDGHATPDHILADGQHRIAKAFFEDVPEVPAYLLSREQARRYLKK